jgi:hypothetical protein
MREDDDDFGHYVPILRRILMLVAVITAVPVVLWTITAFVRAYVVPAKLPAFHQLASTASINAPATSPAKTPATDQTKLPDPQPATAEARTTLADASASSTAPKGPLLGDHPPQAVVNPPPGAMNVANVPTAIPAAPKSPEVSLTPTAPAVPAASESSAPNTAMMLAAQQPPAATTEADAETLPATAPLTGQIPLPRQRPRELGTVRIADIAPSKVPIPRPRPDAGAGARAETSDNPIGFIQNLFH